MAVHTALYQFVVSFTALYPLVYVLAHTSTYHLVPPCTRGTGFQMNRKPPYTRPPYIKIQMHAMFFVGGFTCVVWWPWSGSTTFYVVLSHGIIPNNLLFSIQIVWISNFN